MSNKISMFKDAQNLRIKDNSIIVNFGTAQQDKLNQFLETASVNAILNAGGRADAVRCYPGTREEVIGKVERWMYCHNELDHRMLWLSGHAGAGKSAISQTVAERGRGRAVPAANFFFFRGDNTRNHAEPLVATLVYQLINFYPALREHLTNGLIAQPLAYKASVSEQVIQLLASPMKRIHHSSSIDQQIILIIDGLDECDDEAAQVQILDALHALISTDGSPFRVMVTSRAESHLVMFFNKIAGTVGSIFLNDDYKPEDDIRTFVIAKFSEIRRTHHLAHTLDNDWPTKIDIDKITSKSSGQFIFAATVMRFIEYSKDSPSLSLLIVHEIRPPTGHSPFAELDALYSHVFSKARDIRVIKWAMGFHVTRMGVTPRNMLQIVGYETLHLQSLFADISTIAQISINLEDQLHVHFYHKSLPDYLRDKYRSGIYHQDEEEIATEVTSICLQKFHNAESFLYVMFAVGKVKKPTAELSQSLLDASKRVIEGNLLSELYCWTRLIHTIIRLYFSTDKKLFKCMLKSWLHFASTHKIDTSVVYHTKPKAAYIYYELYRVFEKVKFKYRQD